jgi:hypothetical protein
LEFIGSGYYLFGVGGAGVDFMDIDDVIKLLEDIKKIHGPNIPVVINDADTGELLNVEEIIFEKDIVGWNNAKNPCHVCISGSYGNWLGKVK